MNYSCCYLLYFSQNEHILTYFVGASNDSSKLFVFLHHILSELKASPMFKEALAKKEVPGRAPSEEELLRKELPHFLQIALQLKPSGWQSKRAYLTET
jgi:hypothetical protein